MNKNWTYSDFLLIHQESKRIDGYNPHTNDDIQRWFHKRRIFSNESCKMMKPNNLSSAKECPNQIELSIGASGTGVSNAYSLSGRYLGLVRPENPYSVSCLYS